jgi:putative MFS transporter
MEELMPYGGSEMFELLNRQSTLTGRQWRIVAAAALGDALEFFDYFLVGFALAIIVGPWNLTFGQSALILLSSGVGAIIGALFFGWFADRVGRKKVSVITILTFSLATGILALTPEHNWLFIVFFRFIVGLGAGGLFCVNLPLTQEFMPTSKRGFVGGIVTAAIPLGVMSASFLGALAAPYVGWRGIFAIGALPAILVFAIRAWVPESPRWLVLNGRMKEARSSIAWVLNKDVDSIPEGVRPTTVHSARISEVLKYPRSLITASLSNICQQIGYFGVLLWAPVLMTLLLKITPAQAAFYMIFVTLGGFAGRVTMAFVLEKLGRRGSGALVGFGAATCVTLAALMQHLFIGEISVFWLMLIATAFFLEGGFAVISPYAAEVWPSEIRTTGMGVAAGIGNIGKVIGPTMLALIVGSSNVVSPQATIDALLPSFLFSAACFAMVGITMGFFGIETRGRSLESLESEFLAARRQQV